jgi:hypothetical protein
MADDMTCGRDDPPGYTCGGSGHVLGSKHCDPETHYEGCQRHFGSLASFDWHFRKGRCATDQELIDHGLHLTDRLVWKMPMDETSRQRVNPLDALTEAMKEGG